MYATTYRDATGVNQAMGRVYGHMFMAVLISMLASYAVGTNQGLMEFFFTGGMRWVTIFAPLAYIFFVPKLICSGMSKLGAGTVLYSFAVLMGLSLASIFVRYSMGSIVSAFMGASVLFGVMSVYGYFTKTNLDSVGKYFFVALIALVIVSILNVFLGNSALQMLLSAIAVIVFLGLTAFDTQQIREMVSSESDHSTEVVAALTLYLNFINIFVSLLQLFGVAPRVTD